MRRRRRRIVRGTGGVVGLLVLAELVPRLGIVSPADWPPSSTVVARMAGLLADGAFRTDVAATLGVWAAGLGLALLVAVPAGLLLGSVPVVNAAARLLVEFLRPIPAVALIPIALLLFASQAQMELALSAYAGAWPILLNTIYAVGEVDPVAVDTARSFGFGRLSVTRRVVLPSVAPFVVTGARVASAIALIVPIGTEMIAGGTTGIGVFILKASGSVPSGAPSVFAAAAIAGLISYLIDLGLRAAERRLFAWHFARLAVET